MSGWGNDSSYGGGGDGWGNSGGGGTSGGWGNQGGGAGDAWGNQGGGGQSGGWGNSGGGNSGGSGGGWGNQGGGGGTSGGWGNQGGGAGDAWGNQGGGGQSGGWGNSGGGNSGGDGGWGNQGGGGGTSGGWGNQGGGAGDAWGNQGGGGQSGGWGNSGGGNSGGSGGGWGNQGGGGGSGGGTWQSNFPIGTQRIQPEASRHDQKSRRGKVTSSFIHSCSAMRAYAAKSVDELRLEDYVNGKRTNPAVLVHGHAGVLPGMPPPQQGGGGGGGGWGSSGGGAQSGGWGNGGGGNSGGGGWGDSGGGQSGGWGNQGGGGQSGGWGNSGGGQSGGWGNGGAGNSGGGGWGDSGGGQSGGWGNQGGGGQSGGWGNSGGGQSGGWGNGGGGNSGGGGWGDSGGGQSGGWGNQGGGGQSGGWGNSGGGQSGGWGNGGGGNSGGGGWGSSGGGGSSGGWGSSGGGDGGWGSSGGNSGGGWGSSGGGGSSGGWGDSGGGWGSSGGGGSSGGWGSSGGGWGSSGGGGSSGGWGSSGGSGSSGGWGSSGGGWGSSGGGNQGNGQNNSMAVYGPAVVDQSEGYNERLRTMVARATLEGAEASMQQEKSAIERERKNMKDLVNARVQRIRPAPGLALTGGIAGGGVASRPRATALMSGSSNAALVGTSGSSIAGSRLGTPSGRASLVLGAATMASGMMGMGRSGSIGGASFVSGMSGYSGSASVGGSGLRARLAASALSGGRLSHAGGGSMAGRERIKALLRDSARSSSASQRGALGQDLYRQEPKDYSDDEDDGQDGRGASQMHGSQSAMPRMASSQPAAAIPPRSVRGAAARALVIGNAMVPGDDGRIEAQVAWVPERVDPLDSTLLEAPVARTGFSRVLVVMATSAGVSAESRKAALGQAAVRTDAIVDATLRHERQELEEVARTHAGVPSANTLTDPGMLGGAGRASFARPGHLLAWVVVPTAGLTTSHVLDAAAKARDAWSIVPAKSDDGFTDLPDDDEADALEDGTDPAAAAAAAAAGDEEESKHGDSARPGASKRPRPSIMLPCQMLCPLTSRELQAASDSMVHVRPASRAVLLPRGEALHGHGVRDGDCVEVVCDVRGRPAYEYEPVRADVAARREQEAAAKQAAASRGAGSSSKRAGAAGSESKSGEADTGPGSAAATRADAGARGPSRQVSAAEKALRAEMLRDEAWYEQQRASRHGRRLPRLPSVNDGFFVQPGHRALAAMTEEQLSRVEGFSVGVPGIGELKCLAPVDLRGEDVAAMLVFEQDTVEVRRFLEGSEQGSNRLPDVPAVVSMQLFGDGKLLGPSQMEEVERALRQDDGAASGQPKRFRDFSKESGVYSFTVERWA